jgi:DNA invertase Pin-like site-specific DNA recombinase
VKYAKKEFLFGTLSHSFQDQLDMTSKTQRAAIYARVSTDETRQNPETQLRQLREYAAYRGFQIVGEYIDYASGKQTERTGYKTLIEVVRKRKVDVVLVFHYDRFARPTIELITRVEEFRRLGVDFMSYQQNVDTTTDIGKLYFTIMAGLAEYESSQMGRQVKAGMARAKAQGKNISRPSLPQPTQQRIKELRRQNVSIRKIAAQVGASKSTVQKYLA